MRRLVSLALAATSAASIVVIACADDPAPVAAIAEDAAAAEDSGPSWLGDAGMVERAPVERPLHELCGIASNPGDLPIGATPRDVALREGYFDAARDLGGVMIRRDFRWSEIEPERGRFAWDGFDALVGEASARGVRLLGTLAYGVPWANAATVGGRDTFPASDPADFVAYATAVATRYRGKVAAWEIWNEPNNGWRFWEPMLSGDPPAYAALLARTNAAIKAATPEAQVMLGGTVFTPQLIEGAIPWLERAYGAVPTLAQSFDVAGIHTYPQYPPERPPELGELYDPPLEAKIQMHAWLLAKHGGADKPIWITEIGWPSTGSDGAARQARLTTRATILAARAGAAGIFWYTLRDGPHPDAFPPEDAFGLLGNDQDIDAGREATPKPVYVALRTLLRVVGERWATTAPAPLHDLPSDGRAVVFRGASGPDVVAAWTVTTSAEATIDRDGDVVGQAGDTRGAVAAGGRVTLSPDVTYVVVR